jgi:hypothetical protein
VPRFSFARQPGIFRTSFFRLAAADAEGVEKRKPRPSFFFMQGEPGSEQAEFKGNER